MLMQFCVFFFLFLNLALCVTKTNIVIIVVKLNTGFKLEQLVLPHLLPIKK